MKVVFLDIDGVLNNQQYVAFRHNALGDVNGYGGFVPAGEVPTQDNIKWDPTNAKYLKALLDLTGAVVVISSSWRISFDIDDFKVMFSLYDLPPDVIIGVTPRTYSGFRGREVDMWLADHPDVTHHVILDDCSDFSTDQPLVKTDDMYGLTHDDVMLAVAYLNERV